MVTRVFLAISFFLPTLLQAQCIADAGEDKIVCVSPDGVGTVQIGGNAATGGTAPYTYAWQASHIVSVGGTTYTSFASDFLDDTTALHPSVISNATAGGETVVFVLTVSDFNGTVCRDTLHVRFSQFVSGLSYLNYSITQGDSVWLNQGTNISGGIPPYTYVWFPNHGLTDSTSLLFWAKPDHSINYSLRVTDSAGCSIEDMDYYRILVGYVGIGEVENDYAVRTYPNPVSQGLHIENPFTENLYVRLLDMQGRVVKNALLLTGKSSITIDMMGVSAGTYVLDLHLLSGKAWRQKIQKK